jgi:hypothetical protein
VSRRSPARRQHAEEVEAYCRQLLRGARTGWTGRSRGACSGGLLLDKTQRALYATDCSGCISSAAAGRARRRCRHVGDRFGYGLTRRRTPPAIRITHHTPHTTARARSRQPETGAAADARVPDADRAAVGATAGAAAGIEGPGGAAGPAGLCATKAIQSDLDYSK